MKKDGIRKINYTWVIVGLCFLMVCICLGFCSSNKSLYLSAITEALHLKRSAFAVGDSIRFISTAVINFFFGTLVTKYSEKKLIGAGFLCLILFTLCYIFAESLWLFYLGSIFLGIGFSWTSTTMVGCVINKWCKEKKGTIMGAVLAANGIGGAVAAQIVSPIIYREGDPFGYRKAYFLVACILLTVGALMMIFFRNNPPGKNEKAIVAKKKGRGQSWVGISYEEAKKTSYFYGATFCIFLTGLVMQSINGIAAAHMKDVGLDTGYVATVLSLHSLALTGFKFSIGFLYDKFGLRVTMTICDVTAVLVMISLALVANSPFGCAMAMFYGIFSSLALPLETIMLPIFASDLFGEKSFNKIMGLFVSVNTAGYAVGSPLANYVFDKCGTYAPILYISAAVMIGITVFFQFILTRAQKTRAKVSEEN